MFLLDMDWVFPKLAWPPFVGGNKGNLPLFWGSQNLFWDTSKLNAMLLINLGEQHQNLARNHGSLTGIHGSTWDRWQMLYRIAPKTCLFPTILYDSVSSTFGMFDNIAIHSPPTRNDDKSLS